jgi:hypothetical protein
MRSAPLFALGPLLAGCVSSTTLATLEQAWQQTQRGDACGTRPATTPAGATHGPDWIGASAAHLRGTLGRENFALATPSGQVAICYASGKTGGASGTGCVDSYLLNRCGVITDYFCR